VVINPKKIAIYGAGGFGREVAWLLSMHEKHQVYDVVGYIDDHAHGQVINGKPVLSWSAFSSPPRDSLVTIAVGNPKTRKKIALQCTEAGYSFAPLVHHSVEMSEFIELGVGSIICCGSILTVNIKIEQHVHINLDCTIGHDVRIGEFTTLSPGVHVSGNVHIGKNVYIGTGANIINGTTDNPLVIADGTVIAAGACVTKSTESNRLYAGVPAEFKKHYA
jgi:sugar O-acyltransferase (sialic acid O-acetyltransferase NeuD family)